MTLSIGLDAALSGLATTSDQTSVVSRNVARAGEPGASRKIANLVTLPGGGVKLASSRASAMPPFTTSCWGRPPTPARARPSPMR
jgi:flagellar hook-associated protein 1